MMENAIGMLEFSSVARGIYTADKMLKVSEVDIVTAMSSCPGKYIVVVHGDLASVQDSVCAGEVAAEDYLVDSIVIPNVSPQVFPAITGAGMPEPIQAIGIVESFSMAQMIACADAILKAASLEAIELRLGTGLGGKAYFTFTGEVAAVETGAAAAKALAEDGGVLLAVEVVARPDAKLVDTLL
jgi:microcompartment protein CcmL/EutN